MVDETTLAAHQVHDTAQPIKELANLLTLVVEKTYGTPLGNFLHRWENVLFSVLAASFLIVLSFLATRQKAEVPGKLQNFLETVVEGLESLVVGIIGPEGKRYVPFIGTLFIYIFTQNMMGLVPGLKSPTSNLNTTAGLAICVFFYVQWVGLKENGLLHYLLHLMGNPKDAIGWALVPLNLMLNILDEFIRPVSLSIRLFGNILGEDALIGAFVGLGILVLSFIHSPVGLPIQVPLMMLAMLTGTIQALVFSLLSTIYISLMLPHEERAH